DHLVGDRTLALRQAVEQVNQKSQLTSPRILKPLESTDPGGGKVTLALPLAAPVELYRVANSDQVSVLSIDGLNFPFTVLQFFYR
ncbi:MAG: hypothetical protein ACKO4L_03725, partial [Nodosilinea sp.]